MTRDELYARSVMGAFTPKDPSDKIVKHEVFFMPLTLEQEEKLSFILNELSASQNELSDWEKSFLHDQVKRYEEWESKMNLSPKQWAILDRMYEKVTGGRYE